MISLKTALLATLTTEVLAISSYGSYLIASNYVETTSTDKEVEQPEPEESLHNHPIPKDMPKVKEPEITVPVAPKEKDLEDTFADLLLKTIRIFW